MDAMILMITAALMSWANPTTDARAAEVREIAREIPAAAELAGVDPWRLAALVVKESGARLDVVGRLGECGPAQVQGRYLRPPMRCTELQTAQGGLYGAARALIQWRQAEPDRYWHCYAAGNHCYAPRAERRLQRLEAELRARAAAWLASRAMGEK